MIRLFAPGDDGDVVTMSLCSWSGFGHEMKDIIIVQACKRKDQ